MRTATDTGNRHRYSQLDDYLGVIDSGHCGRELVRAERMSTFGLSWNKEILGENDAY
jgi:hypothetical protein